MNQTFYWEQTGENMRMIGNVPREFVERVRAVIVEASQTVHGNSEPVYVVEIDPAEYSKHLAPRGKAKPLEDNATFPSALAASYHLGYNHNEVCQALSRDKRAREQEAEERYGKGHTASIRPEATLRGVRLQYERDCRA